jgi:molybdopterin-guanine dinucleotide biosynthesis protein A
MGAVEHIAGFILAGGASSRMGRDKALLELDGVPLVVRTARLVTSVAGSATVIGDSAAYRSLGLRTIADDWPGAGPLGGIATALRSSRALWSLVVACDLPYLTGPWLEYAVARCLASHAEAVIPKNASGTQPLCAVYHRRAEGSIRNALALGNRKVRDALDNLRVEIIEPGEWKAFDSEGYLFKNMNSPADYEEARARLNGGKDSAKK